MKINSPSFCGPRLREAREARALSQVALSDLLGVSAPSVSQYESDDQTPSPVVMARICEKLSLPPQFFMTPRRTNRTAELFWRSRSAATKRAREAHERKYDWFRDIVSLIATYLEFPSPNILNVSPPEDPTTITNAEIESIATRTRRHWELGDGPISNLVWLIENNGGVVVRGELGDQSLDAFSDWDGEVSGRCYIFLGSDKESAARSRFDAGHELGHAILHRNVPARLRRRPEILKLIEDQANYFSGAFMLPAATFPSEVFGPSLDALLHLKPRWRMSVGAMAARLRNLSIIGEDRYRQIRIGMSRKGWPRREPLDDVLEVEEPRLLKRSIDLLLDKGVLSGEELELSTMIRPADIEKLLGLPAGYLDEPSPPLYLPLRMA
jgi:Zn-dependent peptidase ImmA (M78 family)/transcriptional regulator with XRE-family HTH domain